MHVRKGNSGQATSGGNIVMGVAATQKSYQRIQLGTIILSIIGIFLSTYALHVEIVKELDKNYKAMCDISASMSCSKVFTSK